MATSSETLDLLIGATALRHGLTLLSNNRRHFEGIEGLAIGVGLRPSSRRSRQLGPSGLSSWPAQTAPSSRCAKRQAPSWRAYSSR